MNKKNKFHDLYLASRQTLSHIAGKFVPPHEIEDIVQETYVKLCQVKNKDKIDSPRSFMFKTTRNLALDYLKQANVKLVDKIDNIDDFERLLSNQNVDEMYQQNVIDNEFAHFCDSVRQLPVQCRKVFVLKKVYGYSQREIATELSISESTVEKHVEKGLIHCTLYMRKMKSHTHKKSFSSRTGMKGVNHE